VDVLEVRKLDAYLKRLFGNARIRVVPKKGDSADIFVGEELIGSYKAATSLYDEEAAKNAKFKQIYDEWKKFRAEEAQWFALSESAMDQFFATKL
jgi:TRAP-type mannitol/chloroaromatic compound transport system substrate-binding protein